MTAHTPTHSPAALHAERIPANSHNREDVCVLPCAASAGCAYTGSSEPVGILGTPGVQASRLTALHLPLIFPLCRPVHATTPHSYTSPVAGVSRQ